MTQGKDAIALSFPLRQPKWKLTWTEDFNKNVLDEAVWSKTDRGSADWQNTQSKDPRCFDFRKGCLVLRGIVNDDLTKDDAPYLTGGVWTKDKFAFEPECRIEIRARLHRAQGAWPAIWLLPFDGAKYPWPHGGEIDIMERLNGDSIAYQTVHSGYTVVLKRNEYPRNGGIGRIDPDDFNVYGVDILEDSVSFHLNGKHTFSYPRIENEAQNGQYPFMVAQHLLLDMQLGGQWVGEVNPQDLPVEMEIDWVKYYRKEE
ncbi:MAG: glycoside hydrolase family 16 protein [Bacteroidaceae bacterium]|nr:glycoside hydrolase family 16 protein [Bacteroidaceae bacterium]